MSRSPWPGLCLAMLLPSLAAASAGGDVLPGAKAMGMGQAFSAIADDPYAMWFNPAGTANTPYSQMSTSLGRMEATTGPLSFGSLAYIRPYDPIPTATIGAGYYVGRQQNGIDRDEFMFHYSQEYKIPFPQVPLSRPLRIGGNFKVVNVEGASGSGVGIGFDGGVQLRSLSGLTGGFGLRDLVTSVGLPRPVIFMAAAYTYEKWLTLAGDMRVRSNLTEFYPGVEAAFHNGLLKVRAGRGLQLTSVPRMALGLGLNYSPVVLDVAMAFPSNGINRPGGAYQMSLTYKFGAPSFAGNFVGQAAVEADKLRVELDSLRERHKNAESQAKSADTRREIAEGELEVVQRRIRELQDQYRDAQNKRDVANYEAEAAAIRESNAKTPPPQPPRIRPLPVRRPAPPVWPKKHEIRSGDTLRTLAKEYYGDGNLWEKIYDANKERIERGLPQEGAVFIIPSPAQ